MLVIGVVLRLVWFCRICLLVGIWLLVCIFIWLFVCRLVLFILFRLLLVLICWVWLWVSLLRVVMVFWELIMLCFFSIWLKIMMIGSSVVVSRLLLV